MKYLVVFAGLFLSVSFLQAQEAETFSLKQAQAYALENNRTLTKAKLDIDLAEQKYKESVGAGLPQLEATVDYMTNFNYEAEFALGASGSVDQTLINNALQKTMESNLSWTPDDIKDYWAEQAFEQNLQEQLPASTIVMEDQFSATLQASMLLFSGQFWAGLKMAKMGQNLSEQSLKLTELDVKESATNSYYGILVTTQMITNIENNQKNLESILKHTNDMYKVGMAEQTDVDQLKISLSQLANTKKGMERNLKLSYNMFRFVLGIEANKEIKLSDKLESLVTELESNLVLTDSLDLESNPTYKILVAQEQLSEKTVELQKWAYAPTLVAFYQYKHKITQPVFDLTPKNAAGVTLSVPIFSGLTKRALVNQAKIELDKVEQTRLMLKDQLAMQSNQLTFELNSAYENYLTQKENVEVAKRVFKNVHNKFRQGYVSSLDLTQANTNYLTAEGNFLSSVMELLTAQLNLDKLNNKL